MNLERKQSLILITTQKFLKFMDFLKTTKIKFIYQLFLQ